MPHWNLRNQLARYLNELDTVKGMALLHEQAEHFIQAAEKRGFDWPGSRWLEDRARWLMHAVAAIPELEKLEKEIEQERQNIQAIDARLVSAVARMQEYMASYALIGKRLDILGFDRRNLYPVQPPSRQLGYLSPLSHFQSFNRSRPSIAYRFEKGKPCLHDTIEIGDYDHRLFILVATNDTWTKYLCECIEYYRERLEDARHLLPVRTLLELSKEVMEKIGSFDQEEALAHLKEIRLAYVEREEAKLSIEEQSGKIDYFYESLRSCETYLHVTPLFLPNVFSRYYGQAPIGMPYYPHMHPRNIYKSW